MTLSVSEIKELMQSLSTLGLQELKLREDGFEMKIVRSPSVPAAAAPCAAPVAEVPAPAAEVPPAPAAAEAANVVASPIVGTFYGRPAPDSPSFVRVGSVVHKGDVLFIIESMKLMNEVTSDFDGTVTKILAEDGAPVEFGQPLMYIE